MGEIEATRVNTAALLEVARGYDALADMVDGVARTHLSRLNVGGAIAGQHYVARGEALRQSVVDVVEQLPFWARATREIASALRTSGIRYVDADTRGVARLG